MFDDENFINLSESQQFSPQSFGMNYNQNFRSSFQRPGPQMMSQDEDDEDQPNPFANIFAAQNNQQRRPMEMSFTEFMNLVNQQM